MKISHVVEHLPTGGLERVVVDLVREQVRRGHDCQVICLHEPGRLAQELLDQGIAVHACHKRVGVDVRALWRLRRHVADHASEILHTHNGTAHYIGVLATFGRRLRCVINTRHGMGARDPTSARERRFARAVRHSDVIVAVCNAAAESLLARGLVPRRKMHVVPNGIHTEGFACASDDVRARIQSELGLDAGTRVIGTVGRLNRIKDQLGLLEAFAKLRARGLDAALVLLGEGAMRAELEARIKGLELEGRAFLLGDRADVERWLPGFDIFALSSVSEGYSIALLEASASALPIVATRVGGNAEIVRDGVSGLLVPPSDPAALASALGSLLEDPARAAAMGAAGRAWTMENGTVAAMAVRYEEVYARCR